jgi:hypothetical protein
MNEQRINELVHRFARELSEECELHSSDIIEAKERAQRRNPKRVPGSRHVASMLAYGEFIIAGGPSIRCEAIQGISAVTTAAELTKTDGGQPQVHLTRILTHFHFDSPSIIIDQHYGKASTGTLVGAARGGAEALLPGRASFSQYLILTLEGRPLVNREPLVMTADRVEEWPPLGATFVSERPTDFYDIEQEHDLRAKPFAALAACKSIVINQIHLPER